MADQPFLALITPLAEGRPAHPIAPGGEPPGIWGPTDPRPTPPIYITLPPDCVDPGVPSHPIYLPIYPAHPIVIPPDAVAPGVPTHPIYLPPVVWPGPGYPAHPIYIPPGSLGGGKPTHPIALPPPEVWPPPGVPAHPIAPGGGPSQGPGFPTHPIVIPPGEEIPPPGNGNTPTHPIYLPPGQPPTGSKALVYVHVAGHGGVWFLIEDPSSVVDRPPGEAGPRRSR